MIQHPSRYLVNWPEQLSGEWKESAGWFFRRFLLFTIVDCRWDCGEGCFLRLRRVRDILSVGLVRAKHIHPCKSGRRKLDSISILTYNQAGLAGPYAPANLSVRLLPRRVPPFLWYALVIDLSCWQVSILVLYVYFLLLGVYI